MSSNCSAKINDNDRVMIIVDLAVARALNCEICTLDNHQFGILKLNDIKNISGEIREMLNLSLEIV